MKTLEEVLGMQGRIDRSLLEAYIAREWVRPRREENTWYFEEIDIARLNLICHLTQDIEVNDEGMDVVLSLLDQLYAMRTHMKHVTHAIARQQPQVKAEIWALISQSLDPREAP
jgi:chaperone modulatory protein CbpM